MSPQIAPLGGAAPDDPRQMLEFLRGLHARPGGTGAILNLIWASKVRGSADLSVLSLLISDVNVSVMLTRHGCDEAQHAYGLARRMTELRFAPFRLSPELDRAEGLLARCRARDVKQVYAERGWVSDPELMELTVAVLILETDAAVKLRANHDVLAHDPETQALLGAILRDDQRHVGYLRERLGWFEGRFSRRAVAAARERLEDAFGQLTSVYYGALQDYFDRAALDSAVHA
jgi:hypothetical protein